MKRFIAKGITVILLAAALAFPLATPAFAASPGTQGQPSQSCQTQGFSTPGNAANNSGSPFAGGQADNVYAGNPGTASLVSNNPFAVSQYDVACFQVSQP